MNELRNILTDIKNRNYIEAYIVFIVGMGILVVDIFGNVSQPVIDKGILAVLSALVYLAILERREYARLSAKSEIDGIVAFHKNRDKMSPLDEQIRAARDEIAALAVQHSLLSHQYLGLLQEKAAAGCKIRILDSITKS